MRKILLVILIAKIIMLVSLEITFATGIGIENNNDLQRRQIRDIGVDRVLDRLNTETEIESVANQRADLLFYKLIKGDFKINFKGLVKRFVDMFIKEVRVHVGLIWQLLSIIVIIAITKHIKANFVGGSISNIASVVGLLSIWGVIFNNVYSLIGDVEKTVTGLTEIIQISVPLLISLSVMSGGVASTLMINPALLLIVELSMMMIKKVIIPLVSASLILTFAGRLGTFVQITRLSQFLRTICGWVIGIIFTIFAGVISIQGMVAGVFDGVTSKTLKFAVGNFVPVVGKFLADSFETVIGYSMIIKNSVGVVVLLGILSVCIIPMLKLLSMALIYKLTAVITQPIADDNVVELLEDISSTVIYAFAGLVVVSLMFFVFVSAITMASNIGYMVR